MNAGGALQLVRCTRGERGIDFSERDDTFASAFSAVPDRSLLPFRPILSRPFAPSLSESVRSSSPLISQLPRAQVGCEYPYDVECSYSRFPKAQPLLSQSAIDARLGERWSETPIQEYHAEQVGCRRACQSPRERLPSNQPSACLKEA